MTCPAPVRRGGPQQRGHVREDGRVEFTFPVHGTVVALARHAARTVSVAWPTRDALEAVLLILSELLGNALKASTGGAVTLLLSWTSRRVRIVVTDDSSHEPTARRAALTDEGGRGLWLVDMLAVRWGSYATHKGKCVWAEVALLA